MFQNGEILWIPNYHFPDGSVHPSGKFAVVLCNNSDSTIIAGLATSSDCVPNDLLIHRFVNDSEKMISFYYFPKNLEITNTKWKFDVNTFIYFQNSVYKLNISDIQAQYGNSVVSKGILLKHEYSDLLYAAYKSQFTKKAYRVIFEKLLGNLIV